jgi:cytochrome b pre-mRNA-processing protein 3
MREALQKRATIRRKASEIYGAIVTQARQREFYAKLGIPDTPAGRYEMVVLHLFLVLERLRAEASRAGALPRALVEAFVADMDDSLREMGTGDMAVARKVRRFAAGLYERSRDYREALAAPEALDRTLAQHALGRDVVDWQSAALAAYVRMAAARLADQDGAEVAAGRIAFPAAATVAKDLR